MYVRELYVFAVHRYFQQRKIIYIYYMYIYKKKKKIIVTTYRRANQRVNAIDLIAGSFVMQGDGLG